MTTRSDEGPQVLIIDQEQLPRSESSHEFVGDDHGGVPISFFLFDTVEQGRGPDLHRHEYAEVFIVQEGEATFTVGDREQTVRAGQVVVVPPGTPHGFKSAGGARLRQIDIHLSARFLTEWL